MSLWTNEVVCPRTNKWFVQRKPASTFLGHALASLRHLVSQMRAHRWPLAGYDRVHHRVAQRAIRRDLMVAQDAVLLGAKALDGTAALMIEEVGAEFDRDAV